jgi:tetratricopeptide (TPR) repeat protein
MKKVLLLFLMFLAIPASANELTEDYLDIATNYCTYGKYNDALVYIDKILQIEPNNSDVKELKNTLLRVMNPEIKSYLTSTNQNLSKAVEFKKSGDRQGEIDALLAVPNDFWSNYFLAEYYRENDLEKSIYYYQKCIELKPNYSQSYLGLAKAYLDNKQFQNSIDTLDKYLEYNPNSDITYALRADACMNMGYFSDAYENITKALKIEENISYLLIEAKILYYKGDYDTAREKLNLLSRNVQTSEVFQYIGLCDYAQQDYKNALLNLDKAIILSDDDKTLNSTYNDIKQLLDKQ